MCKLLNPAMVAEEDEYVAGKCLQENSIQAMIGMFDMPLSERSGRQLNIEAALQILLARSDSLQKHWTGKDILFTDFAQGWFAKKKVEVSANTFSKYEYLYKHAESFLAGLTLTQVTRDKLQLLITGMVEKGYAVETIKQVKCNILNPIMDLAEADGHIEKNPCRYVTTPKRTYGKKRAATDAEVKTLMEVSKKHRLWILVPLLAYTGLRRGEAEALTWDDIDLVAGTLKVDKSYTQGCDGKTRLGKTKSRTSNRILPIPSALLSMLKTYRMTEAKGRKYVLSQARNDKKIYPRVLSRTFKEWCDKAGIQGISLHSLRHTFATALYEHGISDGVIIKLTGHSDTRVLENYYIDSQRDTTIQRKAIDVLDGAFSPSKVIEGDFGHKKGEPHNDSCEALLAQ